MKDKPKHLRLNAIKQSAVELAELYQEIERIATRALDVCNTLDSQLMLLVDEPELEESIACLTAAKLLPTHYADLRGIANEVAREASNVEARRQQAQARTRRVELDPIMSPDGCMTVADTAEATA